MAWSLLFLSFPARNGGEGNVSAARVRAGSWSTAPPARAALAAVAAPGAQIRPWVRAFACCMPGSAWLWRWASEMFFPLFGPWR